MGVILATAEYAKHQDRHHYQPSRNGMGVWPNKLDVNEDGAAKSQCGRTNQRDDASQMAIPLVALVEATAKRAPTEADAPLAASKAKPWLESLSHQARRKTLRR
jgi:hypothetical protein